MLDQRTKPSRTGGWVFISETHDGRTFVANWVYTAFPETHPAALVLMPWPYQLQDHQEKTNG